MSTLTDCPECRRTTLDWDPRSGSWLCKGRSPDCSFSESEREHTRRLAVKALPADAGADEAIVADEKPLTCASPALRRAELAARDGPLYRRCPICAGSLVIPGAIMNSFPCACKDTPTPGYQELKLSLMEVDRLRLDHDRLLVALWEVAMIDDDSDAAYTAASHVHDRDTSVYIAMRNLKLPLPDPETMVLPDHETKKALRDERKASPATRDPDAPPADSRAVIDELRLEVAALRAQLSEAHTSAEYEAGDLERYARGLSESHKALGGDGRWHYTTPGDGRPPASGELAADVPVMAGEMRLDRDRLLAAVEGLLLAVDNKNPSHPAHAAAVAEARVAFAGRTALAAEARLRLAGGGVAPPAPSATKTLTLAELGTGETFVLRDAPEPKTVYRTMTPVHRRKGDEGTPPLNVLNHESGVPDALDGRAAVVRVAADNLEARAESSDSDAPAHAPSRRGPCPYPAFGELDVGETFVVPPLAPDGSIEKFGWHPKLLMKIAPVKRTDRTLPDLECQDHETGVLSDMPAGVRVVRVRTGAFGRRPLFTQ